MSILKKIFNKLLSGKSDNNFDFNDIRALLRTLEFSERIKGSHHIFYKTDIPEIINIQPVNNKAKPYQVKQIRNLIAKYKMGDFNE